MDGTRLELFEGKDRRTTLLHGDVVALCLDTGKVEIHRPERHEEHRAGPGKYESLRFSDAVVLTPNAEEAEILGIVAALPGAERLTFTSGPSILPDRFRVWRLVAPQST